MFACLYVISILLLTTTKVESSTTIIHRRALHQPFFPIDSVPPPPVITQPPPPHTPSKYHYHKPKPKPKLKPKTKSKQFGPKYPFSSQSPPPAKGNDLFFPSYSSPPSPPSPPSAHSSSSSSSSSSSKSLPTFPANITSMGDLPQSSPSKPNSHKLAAIAITVSLVSAASIALIAASLLYYHRRHHKHIHPKPTRSHSLRLCDTAASDKPPHVQLPPLRPRNPSGSSAEFLNLGTLADPPRIADQNNSLNNVAGSSSVMGYQKLGSPELHPLPPLPRRDYRRNSRVGFLEDYEEDNDAEFFSPEASSNGTLSPNGNNNIVNYRRMSQTLQSLNSGNRRSSNSKTPSDSASPTSPSSSKSIWLDSVVHFRPPPRPEVKSPSPLPSPGSSLWDTHSSPARAINFSRQQQYEPVKMPPPPPPPLPPMDYWEAASLPTPAPSRDPVNGPPPMPESPTTKSIAAENLEEIQKPKLKSLYWDKVKASSNTTMVWDQMKSSTSFQLNEEMMETLFMINSSKSTAKDFSNLQINNENRVLDPKKSQNIAILLRALNATIDEVCEGLLEGNIDNLGTDLLESLSKMAPTKEEECKLIEFNDVSKLGPAEKFLKALLDVPFAFKRVDALLYIANFDSEVDYLKRSFETLEAACDELRNSKMFLKLLEAVLKTGNRLNVGTNRGDAHAFKLDTLLKLADIKGTDGRTTLLHFVVQEIIRTEGHSRLSVPNLNPTSEIEINQQSELRDDVELRKIGLQVVSSLSGELSNVKIAASMNSNMLYSEVGKLATGIAKIGEVFRLNEEINGQTDSKKFRDSMNGFLKKAKNSIIKIQAQESAALSMVKEITEYFHGNSIKEEAHPFRIFMVVGDFLSVLDQVCRDVGKVNERIVVYSARPFQMS